MSGAALYDVEDLRKEIRTLKATKNQLENERVQLLEETAKGDSQLKVLRQEHNLLAPIDETRFNVDETGSDDVSLIDNMKFRQMNQKLDMEFLIQDMKESIPRLEKLAKRWETKIKSAINTAQKGEKTESEYPPILLQNATEIEDLIGQKIEETFQLKARIGLENDKVKGKKTALANDIARLRHQLNSLYDEKELLLLNEKNIDNAVYQEQIQLEILRKQHIEAREALSVCHNGNGWKAEAFLSITDKLDNTVSVSKLPKLLSKWIVCSDSTQTINSSYIQTQLHALLAQENISHTASEKEDKKAKRLSLPKYGSDSKDGGNEDDDEDEMYYMSDNDNNFEPAGDNDDDNAEDELIVIKSATDGTAPNNSNVNSNNNKGVNVVHSNDISTVDFKMFCKLCDRIIIMSETNE